MTNTKSPKFFLSKALFISLLIFGSFLFFYKETLAVVTDKLEYWSNEGILVSESSNPLNPLILYDLNITDGGQICKTYESQVKSAGSMGLVSVCSVTGDFMPVSSYSLIELNGRRAHCNGLSYIQCKESVNFINEALFLTKVLPPPPPPVIVPTLPPSGGGVPVPEPEAEEPTAAGGGGGGPTSYRPEVQIYSPLDGKVYGTNIEIIYEAADKNDSLGQNNLGLGGTPVTIFYSRTSDIRQRVQLGTNLPEKGVFKWNTKELPDGDTYNVIVSAIDKVNETGESVSGNFSIDHTAPVFIIKTNPTITKGEDVKILVESSKELISPPILRVAQNEFNFMDVQMSGSGFYFEGLYRVIRGYDGPARIEISGKDMAGNESSLIVSGGQFSVGILPPPKPVITSPLDRDIAPTGAIEVRGKARKDTEVILSLNGSEKFSKIPDANGEFVFSNLKLRPDFNFGNNIISIISKDIAGNISEPADINLKYNLPPEIFIDAPVKGQTLGTTIMISARASDKNRDKLKFKYEVSKNGGLDWILLLANTDKKTYLWDTTTFEDGDYLLRMTVSDGTSEKVATVDGLIIKNLLPTFSFDDGEKTVTNKKTLTLGGTVASSNKSPTRANILSVEYSLDGGEVWSSANIDNGVNTPNVKFSFTLNFAEEKTYKILLRAKDDRSIYGRGTKIVVAIFEPPIIPSVTSHKDGAIIDDSFDKNRMEAGVQINISGTSKPNTNVSIVSSNKIFSGVTDAQGKFIVSGVSIRNHGDNILEIYAEDEAGNKSGKNNIRLIYNNPPILKFINPRNGRGLNHKAGVEFRVSDPDGDDVKRTILSLKKPGETVFRSLDINTPEGKFELDVSLFEEGGGYELKLESTDGVSSSSEVVPFFVDNTLPTIFMNNVESRNFKKDFRFEATGTAEDSLSGVEFVEYSLDNEHWFKAIITKGYLTKKASFSIKHPFTLDDGEYNISFRAVDAAGNFSKTWNEKIFVDTMPPRLGSYDLSFNNISIYPEVAGFSIVEGSKIKIRASFESDTKEVYLFVGSEKVLVSQQDENIWEGEFIVGTAGIYDIKFAAKDNFDNLIENKLIGTINSVPKGVIRMMDRSGNALPDPVEDAILTVLIYSEDRQNFERWPGEYYSIENPVYSNSSGQYSLFLPAGKYQINVQKTGFVKLKTKEFSVSDGRFINLNMFLKKREGFRGMIEDVLEKIMVF
jgi:hypothetical protein